MILLISCPLFYVVEKCSPIVSIFRCQGLRYADCILCKEIRPPPHENGGGILDMIVKLSDNEAPLLGSVK